MTEPTLTQFVLDRIAEREAAALAAAVENPPPWTAERGYGYLTNQREKGDIEQHLFLCEESGHAVGAAEASTVEYIALNDPAYVLADLEAKRRIVELHASCWVDSQDYRVCVEDNYEDPCHTLRLLGLPFADHPGYREGWRL